MDEKIECPVDGVSVDENRARIGAFFVLVLGIGYVISASWLFPAFLLVDFILRAAGLPAFSLIAIVSGEAARLLKIKSKLVDRAPKRFAAATGAVFSGLILLAQLLGWHTLALSLTFVLLIFASLESFVGFCAGCYVYSLLKPLR
jgi:Domain of unknown function (DUF4395)